MHATILCMMRFDEKTSRSGGEGYLDGQMIIAMPGIGDDRFARTVIYLCAHSEEGAMGLVVNKPSDDITFPDLLSQLGVVDGGESIQLPDTVSNMPVHLGGPVETGRGFVLHSSDYYVDNSTLAIDSTISLTATLDVLKAIARGQGPQPGADGAWLCGLVAGPTGIGNPVQWLAAYEGGQRRDLQSAITHKV
jgi:putative transcriptional regulator